MEWYIAMSEDYTELSQIKASCVHHWIIAEAAGPTSEGACKKCGIIKPFSNSIFAEKNHITLDKDNDDIHHEWRQFTI